MRIELIGASLFLAAGAWVANAGGTTGIEIDPITTGPSGPPVETYVMRGAGAMTGHCEIDKGRVVINGLASVIIHGACENVLPGASRIRYWRDREDGSVELIGEGGTETLVTFGVGDGADFESYRPIAPLVSLTARI